MIVREFLNGDSLKGIKEKLEKASIPSPARESKWTTQTILRILQNEKYAGDVLLQKTYTSDFLEGKVKKNNGELPQYYIKDNHPAIIPREMFLKFRKNSPGEEVKNLPIPRRPKPIVAGLPANMPCPKGWSAGTAVATSAG